MTSTNSERLERASGPSRRLLAVLIGLLLTLAAIVSGAPPATAQNAVRAQPAVMILTVGPHPAAVPGSVGVRGPPQLRLASATGVAAEEGGTIYRTGSCTEGALTDPSGVSFRDSVSSSTSSEHPQVFRQGDKIWGVDTAKPPPGSVVRDGVPEGHVSVSATPDEITSAIVDDPFLAELGLNGLDEFGAYRIPK